jgi:uncharacterized protein (UPF0548 family)
VRDDLSYEPPGLTTPASSTWTPEAPGFRRYERTVSIGHGQEVWDNAASALLCWGVKTRSGFGVRPIDAGGTAVREGADYLLTARLGPLTITEPVRVVSVVDVDDSDERRCGFAYGTKVGHPVCGEEAFIVHRGVDGTVWLTLRSLTRPARNRWRYAFPAILVAQRWYRRRYLKALLPQ